MVERTGNGCTRSCYDDAIGDISSNGALKVKQMAVSEQSDRWTHNLYTFSHLTPYMCIL